MPLSKDSKPRRRRKRLIRMRGHNSSKGGADTGSNGFMKISRLLDRGKRQTAIPAIYAAEDKKRRQIRRIYHLTTTTDQ